MGTAILDGSCPMNDRTLPLGVLDLGKRNGEDSHSALRHTLALAVQAEAAGFRRFWVAEHHVDDAAHSTPEILVAAIAGATSTIRVGSGGVLLRYYSPYKVAETFLALEAMYPGRVDLGVAKGPGVIDDAVASALVSGNTWELENQVFERKMFDLCEMLEPRKPVGRGPRPGPRDISPPPIWILGSGPGSSALAGRTRRAYAVAAFLAGRGFDVSEQTSAYRRATVDQERMPMAVAVSVTAAETARRARERDRHNVNDGYLPANIIGDPDSVAGDLREVRRRFDADEVLITAFTGDRGEWGQIVTAIGAAWRAQDRSGGRRL